MKQREQFAGELADQAPMRRPARSYADYQKHFRELKDCLAAIKEDPTLAIYFGNRDADKHHHRISVIPTPGGKQYAFHRASWSLNGWQYGSGEYLGLPDNTEPLIDVAQRHMQDYYTDSSHPLIAARQHTMRAKDQFCYYTSESNA